MFWKRTRKRHPSQSERSLFEAPRERRSAYRVTPNPDKPVVFKFAGGVFVAQNISAGGAALVAPELSGKGLFEAQLQLPDEEPEVSLKLEVLRKEAGTVCHCRFIDVPPELENRLFRYVLEREKEIIRLDQA